MMRQSRREFLTQVSAGMVAASVGTHLAGDLGFSTAFAAEGDDTLSFGRLEPLVVLMQETAANRLLPLLNTRLQEGTPLRDLVAAGALANSRTFGGEDYIGFHTLMAMAPAYHMANEMPEGRRALPVFKVLYRNTNRIQERGGRRNEVLRPVTARELPADRVGGEVLREQARARNINQAEQTLAALAVNPEDAFNQLLMTVQDAADVHRTVLPHRAWELAGIIGRDQALTLLRNSLRYCVQQEGHRGYVERLGPMRAMLPRLLDEHRLLSRPAGVRQGDNAWVERFSNTVFAATPEGGAAAVAGALAEGFAPSVIAEALSLAANQLVLRDEGRPQNQVQANRPLGSVHGDGIGVHACDTLNAWRHMARVGNPRNQAACLILAGYNVAQDRSNRGGEFLNWQPYPRAEARERMSARTQEALLRETEDAIRNRDQARATAAAWRYGEQGHPDRPMFDLLLKYALSEDGALHAEKFYRTVVEEYHATRPAFRWRQVIALARVTASQYGFAAPGHEEACRLLRM